MDNKIKRQDRHFLEKIEADIPNIIKEAYDNPFRIEDFAEEQYEIFESDPQHGFTDYKNYSELCKAFGYKPRNKSNFDKFNELDKIYKERIKCATTSKDSPVQIGMDSFEICEEDDLPF